MTPGVDGETVDGMSLDKIGSIMDALRHERYRFQPVRRTYIPKKNGKSRPLGLPSWSDKLVGEVIRLLLEAYYEPRFSDRSHVSPPVVAVIRLSRVADKWDGNDLLIDGESRLFRESRPHQMAIPRGEDPIMFSDARNMLHSDTSRIDLDAHSPVHHLDV